MSYAADYASALAAVREANPDLVAFTLAGQGTYDSTTDTTAAGDDLVVTGYAVEKKGALLTYEKLSLIAADARTLFFVGSNYGDLPPRGATVPWGGISYTVKYVEPVAPDGTAIGATVVIAV